MSANGAITHCRHGLDLRIYPRCYLCTPLPVELAPNVPSVRVTGCTCPTPWHGIMPPPCPVHNPGNNWISPNTNNSTGGGSVWLP